MQQSSNYIIRIIHTQHTRRSMATQPTSKYHTALELSTLNQSVASHSNASHHLPPNQHRKYGNMKILFENDRFLITLGPDYWCFLFAITFFVVVDFVTVTQIHAKDNTVLAVITIVGATIQVLGYLMIAISNPGIITQADFDTEQQQSNKPKRYCNICSLPMLPRSRHCSECDVCIKGYDHHCPWTSKCIGQHNLYRFYFFATYTPLFLVYCFLVIALV